MKSLESTSFQDIIVVKIIRVWTGFASSWHRIGGAAMAMVAAVCRWRWRRWWCGGGGVGGGGGGDGVST